MVVPSSSLQHETINIAQKLKTNERILSRPRNTSTGSLPKNCNQENGNAALNLRKTASNSDVYNLVSLTSRNVTPSGSTTLISDEVVQDKIFYKRHNPKSASAENITFSSREKPTNSPFFSPQIRQKKLSADLASFSSVSSSSSSPANSPNRTRKFGTVRRLNSFENINAESSPIPTRRATVIERRISRSSMGHKPITRMISCPQLNCSHEFRTLSSMSGERSLSRKSTELPELMAVHKAIDDKRDETEHNYRCVSPNNLERTMMDKNLQNRINAFLDSLSENELGAREFESDTCLEELA